MPPTISPSPTPAPALAFDDAASFARKLIHDVRNGLNALDLQLASMLDQAEETASPLLEEVLAARRMLGDEARRLSKVSAKLRSGSPEFIDYRASDLVEDLRSRVEQTFANGKSPAEWVTEGSDEQVRLDFELFCGALVEVVANALHFGGPDAQFSIKTGVEGGVFVLDLIQSVPTVPSDPAEWGTVPFRSTRRGAYGLGLFSARRAITALGGSLEIRHDAPHGELHSRFTLPLTLS